MKRYKVGYWNGDKTCIRYVSELSGNGSESGVQKDFHTNGTFFWWRKIKNGRLFGISKAPENEIFFDGKFRFHYGFSIIELPDFVNFKKGTNHGISIVLEKNICN